MLILIGAFPALEKHAEAHQKHSLSGLQLVELRNLAAQGRVAEGWKTLGAWGDGYAEAASQVLQPDSDWGVFSSRLVRWHWIHSAGEPAYKRSFIRVARQHFSQYLKILFSGYYPDSREICLSYRKAVTDAGLPPVTVFDGAWIRSGFDRLARWEIFSRVSTARWADSRVFDDVSPETARRIVLADLTDVLQGRIPPDENEGPLKSQAFISMVVP